MLSIPNSYAMAHRLELQHALMYRPHHGPRPACKLFPDCQDEAGIAPPVRLYTESVLVVMPFPDFSMPFNVITYVCTLVALFFGSIANVVSMRAPSKVATTVLLCMARLL